MVSIYWGGRACASLSKKNASTSTKRVRKRRSGGERPRKFTALTWGENSSKKGKVFGSGIYRFLEIRIVGRLENLSLTYEGGEKDLFSLFNPQGISAGLLPPTSDKRKSFPSTRLKGIMRTARGKNQPPSVCENSRRWRTFLHGKSEFENPGKKKKGWCARGHAHALLFQSEFDEYILERILT